MRHGFGLDIPENLEDVCDPRRLALVVYDMQAGILSQLAHASDITDRVVDVLDAARDGGYRTFFTRHMSLPTKLSGVSQLRTAMAWQRVHSVDEVKPWFLRDTPPFHLIPEMTPRHDEAVFDKLAMSCFAGTPLDLALRDCGISAFAIVGVALEVGIEPSVRHGADLGYLPVVVADGCGGRDEEARQRALDGFAFTGDVLVTDVETICRLFRRSAAPDR